uniref:C-type lectin domain-containing protein n=1 Tax=Amazona collaria TaxID=241587 RepID=A0A8B9FRR6_9PSIT
FSLKCIKDKRVPIGVTVVVAALKFPSCPACPAPDHSRCLENGIGYREKCFYFVEDEAEWNRSESFCLSLGAHLATIDMWEELRFLLRYGGSLHYWIGLRREGSAPWTWVNGSLFNNSVKVRVIYIKIYIFIRIYKHIRLYTLLYVAYIICTSFACASMK